MTKDAHIDDRLLAGLKDKFNGLDKRTELGTCLIYTGERKVDGLRYDLYLPKSSLRADLKRLGNLTTAFENFVRAASSNLQGYLPLVDMFIKVDRQNIPVLALVECPETLLDSSIDILSFNEKKRIFLDILNGLAALHRNGLVHGNLSDRSVRRETSNGRLKLCDMAFSWASEVPITEQPLPYQSAKILANGTPTFEADLHAAGMLGYRLFMGERGVWRALTGQEEPVLDTLLRQRISAADAPVLSGADIASDDPDQMGFLAPVLARMIGHGPEPFANAEAAQRALNSGGYTVPPESPGPDRSGQDQAGHRTDTATIETKKNRLPTIVLATVLGAALLFLGYTWVQDYLDQQAYDSETEKLQALHNRCNAPLDVPPGRLQELATQNRLALQAALEARNENALNSLCDVNRAILGMVPDWNRSLALKTAAIGLLELPNISAYDLPTQAVERLEGGIEAFDAAIASLTSATPENLAAAVTDMERGLDTMRTVLRTQEREAFGQAIADLSMLDLSTVRLEGLRDTVGDAQSAADFLDLFTDRRKTRQSALAGKAEQWQSEGLKAVETLETRISALPLYEKQSSDLLSQAIPAEAAFETLNEAILSDSAAAMRTNSNTLATLAEIVEQAETLAWSNQLAVLEEAVEMAQTALRPDLDPLTEILAPQAEWSDAPQGQTLDDSLAKLTDVVAQLETAVTQAKSAAETSADMAQAAKEAALASEVQDAETLDYFSALEKKAESAQNAAEWGQAAAAWTEMAALATDARTGLETTAQTAKDHAKAARTVAEAQGADLAAGDLAFADGDAAFEKALFQTATDAFKTAEAAFALAAENTAQLFAVGVTGDETATLMAICQRHSRVRTSCSAQPVATENRREVELTPFQLELNEVSVAQFDRFVRDTGYVTDAERLGYVLAIFSDGSANKLTGINWRAPQGPGSFANPNEPVVGLSVEDAKAYCAHAGGRIPTAEEWEVTVRGTSGHLFPWGNSWNGQNAVWQGSGGFREPVSAGIPGQGGHKAMAGNAREWVSTPAGAGLMGGSWLSVNPSELAAPTILQMNNGAPGVDFGVRCAKDLEAWN